MRIVPYLRSLHPFNKHCLLLFVDPAAQLGLAGGADSHWGSYNSSYASYLGQTQAASFNSSTAALSAYGSAVAGATASGVEIGSAANASSAPAGSGHLLPEHGSSSAQIPTGRISCTLPPK